MKLLILFPYLNMNRFRRDEGENAVIIQAEGRIPSCRSIREHVTGPTTDEQCVWNAGGAPTMFVFLKEAKHEGYIIVEDI
ncbi:hypothetical protein [Paenibacillus tundrae]